VLGRERNVGDAGDRERKTEKRISQCLCGKKEGLPVLPMTCTIPPR